MRIVLIQSQNEIAPALQEIFSGERISPRDRGEHRNSKTSNKYEGLGLYIAILLNTTFLASQQPIVT